ncbi:MAG: hypothetical protein H7Z14_12700 [Anaerolineae bacterium]|nr:hypothetical protein [Phycisphaerae bacterium]
MTSLFLVATGMNLLALIATMILGYGVSNGKPWSSQHQLAGVLATIFCCGVHCIVFTYFIATAKWVQHAVTVKHLDQSLVAPTRSFKAAAFPAALSAMAIVFLAAVLGAATFGYQIRPIYHHVTAIVGIAINAIVALIEYRAIDKNAKLIDQILATINPAPA